MEFTQDESKLYFVDHDVPPAGYFSTVDFTSVDPYARKPQTRNYGATWGNGKYQLFDGNTFSSLPQTMVNMVG